MKLLLALALFAAITCEEALACTGRECCPNKLKPLAGRYCSKHISCPRGYQCITKPKQIQIQIQIPPSKALKLDSPTGICCPRYHPNSPRCPFGKPPLKGVACGRGASASSSKCPPGYYCNSGNFLLNLRKPGACCPSLIPPPKCPNGKSPLKGVFCGIREGGKQCPSGYECRKGSRSRVAFCCPSDGNVQPSCPGGKTPLNDVFCGRGPDRQDCPAGYECNIDPADRFAVCCPQEAASTCVVSGCNSEICAPEHRSSICIAPTEEQKCLKHAKCGAVKCDNPPCCGWIDTPEYKECLDKIP